MKRSTIRLFLGLVILILGATMAAQAQEPAQVHKTAAADERPCRPVAVDVSGNSVPFFPGGQGVILFPGEGIIVEANDRNDHVTLVCHGRIEPGADVRAIDAVTGEEIDAIFATFEESCEAANSVWPGSCETKGQGNGRIELDFDNTGALCSIGPLILTPDWKQIWGPGGQTTITCHGLGDASPQ